MKLFACLALLTFAGPTAAQEIASAGGAILRALDKNTGLTEDLDVLAGGSVEFGRLNVTVSDCRYPVDDPTSNAYAHLDIADRRSGKTEFSGWMVAASPALSALDDPRYDVWLLRCKTS